MKSGGARLRAVALLSVVATAGGRLILACSSDGSDPAVNLDRPDAAKEASGPRVEDAGVGVDVNVAAPDASDAAVAFDASVEPPADAAVVECLAPIVDGGPDAAGDAGGACPASGPCSAPCLRVANLYRAGLAEVAIECIRKLPSCDGDESVIPCIDIIVGRACEDPTSASYCAPLVDGCRDDAGSFTASGCGAYANALSEAGRDTLGSCVSQAIEAGACTAQIGNCAAQIR